MQYDVPLIAQRTSMGCWAASIAMILSWKNQACFDPHRIAANPGGTSYTPSLQTGLDPNDTYILQRNGFVVERPQCYLAGAISGLLAAHGPLWVAGYVGFAHIRVVTGMAGDILSVNDPLPEGAGARYDRTFTSFFGEMETLGMGELGQPAPIYVAHLTRQSLI